MKEYRLGGRFRKFRNLCMIIVAAMVFGFYFIYDYLYEEMEWWDPKTFAWIFLLVGFLFVVLTGVGLNTVLNTMRYRLLDNALEVSCWGNSVRYYYKDFREAYYRGWGPFDTIPVVFVMKDKKNLELFHSYQMLTEKEPNTYFGGRLAEYKYYDMDQVIASALDFADRLL